MMTFCFTRTERSMRNQETLATGVARKNSIAVVGQYLRVKAVDDTDKVIGLETANSVDGITAKIVVGALVVTDR